MGHRVIGTNEQLRELVSRYSDPNVIGEYGPISQWRFSPQVTDFSHLFENNATFNEDISNWDTSNVTDMDSMFYSATSFNQPIGNWNVSRVRNMNSMFYNATSFNQPLNNWNIGRNVHAYGTFNHSGISIENIPESIFETLDVFTLYSASLKVNCEHLLELGYDVNFIKKVALIQCDPKYFTTLDHPGHELTFDDLGALIRYTYVKLPHIVTDQQKFKKIVAEILQVVNLTEPQEREISTKLNKYLNSKRMFKPYADIVNDLIDSSQLGGRKRRYRKKRTTKKKVFNKKRKSVRRHK